MILADPVEEMVGQHMVGLLSDPENAAAIVAQTKSLNDARAEQMARLEEVEQMLADLQVKWAAGELIQPAYDRAKPVLDGRRAKLLAGLESMAPAALVHDYDASGDWSDMYPEQKRAVITRYRVRIEVLPKQNGTRRFDPNRVVFTGPA